MLVHSIVKPKRSLQYMAMFLSLQLDLTETYQSEISLV